MTPALQALIKRFVVETVRREMTDIRAIVSSHGQFSSYDDRFVEYAKETVQEELKIQFAALGPEDLRG